MRVTKPKTFTVQSYANLSTPDRKILWKGILGSGQGRLLCGGAFELKPNDGKEPLSEETQAERIASECKGPGVETSLTVSRNRKKAKVTGDKRESGSR